MKLNELRIGNFLFNDRCRCTIVGLFEKQIVLETKQGNQISSSIRIVEPILLTEDWFAKFGFIIDDENCWSKNGLTLDKRYTGDDTYEFEFNGSCVSVLFVHELQNLHFALTKKELSLSVC